MDMDNLGMTRLGVAALSGDAERVKEHLAKDDAFERDAVGNTVAHYAAVAGDPRGPTCDEPLSSDADGMPVAEVAAENVTAAVREEIVMSFEEFSREELLNDDWLDERDLQERFVYYLDDEIKRKGCQRVLGCLRKKARKEA